MSNIAVTLNLPELQALLELSDTELFRERFINPRFPGHKSDPERLQLAASAIRSLREVFNAATAFPNNDPKQPASDTSRTLTLEQSD